MLHGVSNYRQLYYLLTLSSMQLQVLRYVFDTLFNFSSLLDNNQVPHQLSLPAVFVPVMQVHGHLVAQHHARLALRAQPQRTQGQLL